MYSDIGGYFELADRDRPTPLPIQGGVMLNSGRNAFEYILRSIGDIKCIYIPYYTCDVVLQPIAKLRIRYRYYRINVRLEIDEHIELGEREYLVANNYFGIKDAYINQLALRFGSRLIVDNSQALFATVAPGTKAFYSPRKFVGVADGGISVGCKIATEYETEKTDNHNSHLTIRKMYGAEAGYLQFKEDEKALNNQPIRTMSVSTSDILRHIDYAEVIKKRRSNFSFIHEILSGTNMMLIPDQATFTCPMVYPYMCNGSEEKRTILLKNKVWVAKYWPRIQEIAPKGSIEFNLSTSLLPLPIDQRYDEKTMAIVTKLIIE